MTQLPDKATAKLQALVDYVPGPSRFKAEEALLEWGIDDHLRLFKLVPNTDQVADLIFDAPVTDIEQVSGAIAYFTFSYCCGSHFADSLVSDLVS